ncbi:hypothetical protein B7R22_05615 [Subtercola boreus]|uniref:Uncharacterized protein n=1 Tax=Subtercola boreus TaxID=120213 RepID=A0A3E0W2S8_9MICO|nr:hypothetical protein [Subtercola boreus]RFA15878.1 hypothetical protein B7R22_05615 [Subtercola boreus]
MLRDIFDECADRFVSQAAGSVEMLLLEPTLAPLQYPLLDPRLIEWIGRISTGEDVTRNAQRSNHPLQIMSENSLIEVRCENGFSVKLSAAMVDCSWRRGAGAAKSR